MQHIEGFTLGEVAVTLAILAILVTVGVPALGSFVADYRLTRAVNLMVTDLNHARTAALTHHTNVVVCPTEDHLNCLEEGRWDQGWMSFLEAEQNSGQPHAPEAVIRHTQNDDALTIRSGQRIRVR